jgi:hypothetical protein
MYDRVADADSEVVFLGLALHPGRRSLANGLASPRVDASHADPLGDEAGIRDPGVTPSLRILLQLRRTPR